MQTLDTERTMREREIYRFFQGEALREPGRAVPEEAHRTAAEVEGRLKELFGKGRLISIHVEAKT